MNFKLFLQEASSPLFWAKSPNICFRSDDFSPLFFNNFFMHLEKNNLLPYPKSRLDLAATDKKTIRASLNQSFLGNNNVFWLSNILSDGMEKGKQDILVEFLNYTGPHHVIYFLPKDTKLTPGKTAVIIDIPTTIDISLVEALITFFKFSMQEKKLDVLKRVFRQAKTISLDMSCMLINYVELINTKNTDELDSYLAHITQTQPSLTLLSEHFFSLNPSGFFSVWTEIEKEYPEMFWLAFWSEQIWKAHHVILYLKKNDFVNAKRMSFRLSYSFINTQWKNFTQQEFKELYHNLYLIDTKIKRGGSSDAALSFFFFSYFFKKSPTNNYKRIV